MLKLGILFIFLFVTLKSCLMAWIGLTYIAEDDLELMFCRFSSVGIITMCHHAWLLFFFFEADSKLPGLALNSFCSLGEPCTWDLLPQPPE